jgi:hypothetical protein
MKRPLHGDDPEPVWRTAILEIFPCQLDGGLIGLSTTVAKEDPVGKGMLNQPLS